MNFSNFNFLSLLVLFSIILLSSINDCSCLTISDEQRDLVLESFPGENSEKFLEILDENFHWVQGFDLKSLLDSLTSGKATNESCHQCDTLIRLLGTLELDDSLLEFIETLACTDSNLNGTSVSKRECLGLIQRLGPPLIFILKNTKVSLMDEGCSVLLGYKCLEYLDKDLTKSYNLTFWELEIPERIDVDDENPKSTNDDKIWNVLHLTDIHLDLFYNAKSNSDCHEALCCRSTSPVFDNKSVPAGYWGDLNGDCDLPKYFVENSIKQIAQKNPDLDVIFFTGDNVPHDVWNTSYESVLLHNENVKNLLLKYFTGKKTPQILPVLGNHEAHPINMYVPNEKFLHEQNYSMNWLYENLTKNLWSQWFLNENEIKTFLSGGYYSRSITSEWKVIVLNSNFAYKANFWRLLNPIDPNGQLSWLMDELDQAEKSHQMVSILGHIPPGDMYEGWLHNYIKIFQRYSNIITGIYNGHTHKDELAIMYDDDDPDDDDNPDSDGIPIAINYISGSLTTFSYLNPSYKVFKMNGKGQPIDYTVYYLDLDKENYQRGEPSDNEPNWLEEFSALESYKLSDLTLKSWNEFYQNAKKDLNLAKKYTKHYYRYSKEYENHTRLDQVEKIKQLVKSIKTVSPFNQLRF